MLRPSLAAAFLLIPVFASTLMGCGGKSGSGDSGSGNSQDDARELRILVTNDGGVAAEGIDAIVEALILDTNNAVIVCAPDVNRTGSSRTTDCGTLATHEVTTSSGYPATAIDGCPADAVNHALANLYTPAEQPHLVISGIHEGQNVSTSMASLSGTIRAAKTAARKGVPALAASQGNVPAGSQFDYPAGVDAVLEWLSDNRATLLQGGITPVDITNLNIPSCTAGSIRGKRVVPPAPTTNRIDDLQDCQSTRLYTPYDTHALLDGFIAQTSIPLKRLRILVTNDDGVGAEGIDAIVEALVLDSDNDVIVSAPDVNKSGSSDSTNCGTLATDEVTTSSGYPATAIDGCPADAVNHALASLYAPAEQPHVVISGINEGQNVSTIVAGLSGTIGAAKTAARSGVPAVAASQGKPNAGRQFDYPAGVDAVLEWLSDNREALLPGNTTPVDITNINIPSCATGSVRGTVIVPLASGMTGIVDPQDCRSTRRNPADDTTALLNGFIPHTLIPLN